MTKGTILGKIVKDISLANYADDEPLGQRVHWAIFNAIPDDMRAWFFEEFCNPPLSQKQGLRLVSWLFKDPRKAIINIQNIRQLRAARREELVDLVKENLPANALMANVTYQHLEIYSETKEAYKEVIAFLSKAIRADEDRVSISIQWMLTDGKLRRNDLEWFSRLIKPYAEYEQLLLREAGEASNPALAAEIPSPETDQE